MDDLDELKPLLIMLSIYIAIAIILFVYAIIYGVRVRMVGEKAGSLEISLSTSPSSAEFPDVMTMVAMYPTVDCYISFNGSPILLKGEMTYTFFYPIKRVTAWSASGEEGKLYIWGEKH